MNRTKKELSICHHTLCLDLVVSFPVSSKSVVVFVFGVQCAFVARVCGVWRGLARQQKTVYVQNASVCTVKTTARVQHAGVLPVHTETF